MTILQKYSYIVINKGGKMADDKNKDTVTFTITVTVEEYEKLYEMMILEGVESINDVYKKALNRNYDFLKKLHEMGVSVTNVGDSCKKMQN